MHYNIIVEPEAIEDLINIKLYITKQDSVTKANKFISELKKSVKSLEHMPQRCRKSLYTNTLNSYDIIHKGYTIVYKIIDSNVHILTIFRQRSY